MFTVTSVFGLSSVSTFINLNIVQFYVYVSIKCVSIERFIVYTPFLNIYHYLI